MNKIKFIRKVAAVGAIYLAGTGIAGEVVQAKKPAFLLSNTCVETSGRWGTSREEISVGKELFTSVMYMTSGYYGGDGQPSSMTCRIRPAGSASKFKTLRLAFGIADNARKGQVTVSVHLDGNQVASRTISSGEKELLLIDVSKASSLAVETSCSSECPVFVNVFQALLEPVSSRPSQRR
ncbi:MULTISPECIES: hypothetical protein [Cyanophyceae]|uniref:hypothetical protein n=1 Tax=Cyanophyceae TaxID=3028117 RepID=UPI0016847B22|nr:hypothetical protein [Trichocoleus sp. FACHB-69]MBD1933067.1 hypothetical protein [Trichocoleus sp. FACHB-69]